MSKAQRPLARVAGVAALVMVLVLAAAVFVVPARRLVDIIGAPALHTLYRAAALTPWSLEAWVHVVVLFWGASVVWLSLPRWRGWRLVLSTIVFALMLESLQLLASARTPRLEDAGLNVVGALIGISFAKAMLRVGRVSID